MRCASGTGIISSIVLESDDLDEVDWEFIGGNSTSVETNYFGKGNTTSYDRAMLVSFISVFGVVFELTTYSQILRGRRPTGELPQLHYHLDERENRMAHRHSLCPNTELRRCIGREELPSDSNEPASWYMGRW